MLESGDEATALESPAGDAGEVTTSEAIHSMTHERGTCGNVRLKPVNFAEALQINAAWPAKAEPLPHSVPARSRRCDPYRRGHAGGEE